MTDEQKYRFYPYTQAYAEYYQRERAKLVWSLGNHAAVEHVGSSAVPGLGGKRIVDIAVGVTARRLQSARGAIIGLGYEFRPLAGSDRRTFFRADRVAEGSEHRIHIHLVESHAEEWRRLVCFRDYLLSHRAAAAEYARVKRAAAELARGDGAAYMREKEGFIERTLRWAMDECGEPAGAQSE